MAYNTEDGRIKVLQLTMVQIDTLLSVVTQRLRDIDSSYWTKELYAKEEYRDLQNVKKKLQGAGT